MFIILRATADSPAISSLCLRDPGDGTRLPPGSLGLDSNLCPLGSVSWLSFYMQKS